MELMKENTEVIEAQALKEKATLDIDSFAATRTWTLTAGATKTDSKTESATTFAANPYESTLYSLGIQKAFEWGGSLSLSNNLSDIDSSGVTRNGFSQSLSYSQDIGANFFGATFFKDKKILEGLSESTKYAQEERIQTNVLLLAQAYTNAQLNKSLVQLQKEAVERADKRMDLIAGRVRDGLREEVDLIQARMALIAAQEQLKSFSISLSSSLDKLGSLVHRNVLESEVEEQSFKERNLRTPIGSIDENLSLKTIEEKVKIVELQREKTDLSYIPKITLSASVTNNDYDPTQSEAMSKGKLGEDQKEVSASVNLSWAIGNVPQRIEDQKVQIDQRVALERKQKLKKSLDQSIEEFQKQVKLLDETIELTSKRKTLADRALVEYTKLYRRGKADLDQVIRAEEDLINTERSLAQNLSQRRLLSFSLASVYGNLLEFILEKK